MKNVVLIPTYNSEKTIYRAIESVLYQDTNEDFEICIVINNCTDGTEKIVHSMSKTSNRKFHILTESKPGIVNALNKGLIFCLKKGFENIFRQDSDDIWIKEKMSKQFEALRSNKDVSVVGTQITICDKTSFEKGIRKVLNCSRYPLSHNGCREWLMAGMNPVAHPSCVIRADVFHKCGLYKHYHLSEDLKLWSDALLNGFKFSNIDENLVDYNFRPNSSYDPSINNVIKNELLEGINKKFQNSFKEIYYENSSSDYSN